MISKLPVPGTWFVNKALLQLAMGLSLRSEILMCIVCLKPHAHEARKVYYLIIFACLFVWFFVLFCCFDLVWFALVLPLIKFWDSFSILPTCLQI